MFKSLQNRPLAVDTPLGPDALTLRGFTGTAALSELFQFELEMQAPKPGIGDYDQVLGQHAAVRIRQADGSFAYFHGLVSRLKRVRQDRTHVHYHATLVPRLWLLSKRIQSRIFQQQSVPDVVEAVLQPLRPDFELKLQNREEYAPRDYCVQYQESDFAFLSRLMEEEGLYYYFKHSVEGHKLIVTDTHTLLPPPEELASLAYDDSETGNRATLCVKSWHKAQEVCTSNFMFWDQCFELPDSQGSGFQTLEAKKRITDKIKAGAVEHNLNLEVSQALEAYDCQPGYAKNFDGIDPTGSERKERLTRVYEAAKRRATRRAEAEAARALCCGGDSNIALLRPGRHFKVMGLFEDAGQYYLTRVEHTARLGDVDRSGEQEDFVYENQFECLPAELPYRPPCVTPRPSILGVQTATVVGLSSRETNTPPHVDKYGRVKVQFHWDRQRQFDGQSSCWLRVAQVWAGQRFGAFFWPRPGHEVVVAFENGDPDCPLVTGSVYNSVNMPPLPLPDSRLSCGIQSSTPGDHPLSEFSCVVFHDQPGVEFLQIHSGLHETSRSSATRALDTTGPTLETCGRLSLPLPGSGTGSGADEPAKGEEGPTIPVFRNMRNLFTAGGAGGIGDLFGWVDWRSSLRRVVNGEIGHWIGETFPAKSEYVAGDRLEVLLFGNKHEHQIWGSKREYQFAHPVDLLASAGMAWLGEKSEAAKRLLEAYKWINWGIINLIGEPSGNFEMLLGRKTEFKYYGPLTEVIRAKKYEYQGKKFSWSGNVKDKAAFGLTLALYAALSASDILGRKFHTISEDGEVEAQHAFFVQANVVPNKLAGILFELEGLIAKTQQGLEDTERAAEALRLGTMATQVLQLGVSQRALERASDRTQEALESLRDVVGHDSSDASTRQAHKYEDRYSLSAPGINLVANGDQGIVLDGTAGVIVHGAAGVFLSTEKANGIELDGGDSPSIRIVNPDPGTITLAVGNLPTSPKIEIAAPGANGITLESGGPTGAAVKIGSSGIELNFGPNTSLSLDATGITMKMGPNQLQLDASGVNINGTIVSIEGTAVAEFKALNVDVNATASLKVNGAILMAN